MQVKQTSDELLLAICEAVEKCPGCPACSSESKKVVTTTTCGGRGLPDGYVYALGDELRLECPQCHGKGQRYSGRGFRFGPCPDCQVRGWIPNPDMAALLRMIRARGWLTCLFQFWGWDQWVIQDKFGDPIGQTIEKDHVQDDDALRLAAARALGVADANN